MLALRTLLVLVVAVALATTPVVNRWPGIDPGDQSALAAAPASGALGGVVNTVAADNDDDGCGGDNDNGGCGGDNDNGGGDNDNGGDGDSSDNGDDDTPDGGAGRQEVTARVAGGPGPAAVAQPPASEVSACLQPGQQLTLIMNGANAAIRNVAGGAVNGRLRRVDPGSLPAAPGVTVGTIVFEVTGGACGGGGDFPQEVNLGVSYQDSAVAGVNEANLTLARLEGDQWVPAEKGAADPANNFVSATITKAGIYGLFQK